MRPVRTILALALFVAACGSGGRDPQDGIGNPTQTASAVLADGHTVELTVPDDWARFTTDGLVVSRNGADMDLGVTPSGPRIVVGVDHDILGVSIERLTDDAAAADYGEVIDEVKELTVSGHPAVSITIRLDSTVARFVSVAHAGTAHLVTAEAPAASWLDDGPVIDQIITGSLRFETSAGASTASGSSATTTETTTPDASSIQEGADEPLQDEDFRRQSLYLRLIASPSIDPNLGSLVQALFDPVIGEDVWNESGAVADVWCDGLGGQSGEFEDLLDLAWSADPAEAELTYGSRNNLSEVVALQLEWRCPAVAAQLLE